MCFHYVYVWVCEGEYLLMPLASEPPRAGVTGGYELADRCWEANSHSLQEQQVILTSEPSEDKAAPSTPPKDACVYMPEGTVGCQPQEHIHLF